MFCDSYNTSTMGWDCTMQFVVRRVTMKTGAVEVFRTHATLSCFQSSARTEQSAHSSQTSLKRNSVMIVSQDGFIFIFAYLFT